MHTLINRALRLGAAALFLAASCAGAQDFPSRTVRIVASEAGGTGDYVSRILAQGLAAPLGQAVVVDNRGGGVIAGETVAKSPPDGHTLLVYGNTLWLLPLMRKQVPYEPQRDFAPVSLAATGVNVLVVHPSLPVKSVKDLIGLARTRPGQLNFSTAAPGTINHLAAELFKSSAKIDIVRISYRGSPSAITAVLTGEVQLTFAASAPAERVIATGKLRPLAVTTATRSPAYPGLPTMHEAGLPGFEAVTLMGVFVPAKTPEGIIGRLNQEIGRVLQQPDSVKRLKTIGADPVGGPPGQLATAIKEEIARMGKVIREAGIQER